MHALSLSCRAALNTEELILPYPVLQCIGAGSLHTFMQSKSAKVCKDFDSDAGCASSAYAEQSIFLDEVESFGCPEYLAAP